MPWPPRLDAHQHCWRLSRGDYGWLDPAVPALQPLCRDFTPADLAPLLQAHGVHRTVLVQAAPTVAETDFLLDLAAAHPDLIAGVVGWVDLSAPASIDTLERWAAARPALRAVRPMLQDLPDADWIARAPCPAVVDTLVRLGLRFDALVTPAHLPALRTFVDRYPTLPVVIDHAAKPRLAEGWGGHWADGWRADLQALAARPQVRCKFSGLLTEADAPASATDSTALATVQPVWDHLLDTFGPARLLWGSDWPVLTLAADYGRWVRTGEALIGTLSAAEQAGVWHDNAARFYDLCDLTP